MTSTVRSADRALSVLLKLAESPAPMTTMDIARECGLPKSSAHHLLNVMRSRNFVVYLEDRRAWALGLSAFEVGAAYMRNQPIHTRSRPFLNELTEELGDTSHLAVLRGTEVVYLAKHEPAHSQIRLVTEVGVRLPAHLTAVGRAILAHLGDDAVLRLYEGYSWPTRTGAGPRSIAELVEVLAEVREAGVAMDDENTTSGIRCVAAPVLDHDGRPVAGIGVTFVSAAKDAAQVERTKTSVLGIGRELSHSFGYRGDALGVHNGISRAV
ncbi:IclR family transcriptional regulator [Microbispora hainanensis]|uniref:IclR family transcriptional regulator n=1 Tax=Microbispora hainanensis TaxID=568844 RepID=UPI0033FA3A8A